MKTTISAITEALAKSLPDPAPQQDPRLLALKHIQEYNLRAFHATEVAFSSAHVAKLAAERALLETREQIYQLEQKLGIQPEPRCCDDEANHVENDEDDVICRSCGEHTCTVYCAVCEETIFESSCCG